MKKTVLLISFMLMFQMNIMPGINLSEKFFRVMTYNIRYAGDEKAEGINSWNNRKKKVASVIRFNNVDLIGLQEALKLQIDDLLEMFPDYDFVGVGRDGGEKGEYSAIFYSAKRFEVLDQSTFWLSETQDKPSKGWDAAYKRIVTWAKFKDKITGNVFYCFNTHFDNIGEEARVNSAELLLKKIEKISGKLPVIVTGDFNFRMSSKAYKIITDELFDAQFVSAHGHYGSNTTFNNYGKNTIENNKIDFIFVNDKVKVNQHGVIAVKFNENYPSDHMPVLAVVSLK